MLNEAEKETMIVETMTVETNIVHTIKTDIVILDVKNVNKVLYCNFVQKRMKLFFFIKKKIVFGLFKLKKG